MGHPWFEQGSSFERQFYFACLVLLSENLFSKWPSFVLVSGKSFLICGWSLYRFTLFFLFRIKRSIRFCLLLVNLSDGVFLLVLIKSQMLCVAARYPIRILTESSLTILLGKHLRNRTAAGLLFNIEFFVFCCVYSCFRKPFFWFEQSIPLGMLLVSLLCWYITTEFAGSQWASVSF